MIKKAYILSVIVFALLAVQFSCKLHDPGAPDPTGISGARYSLIVTADPNVLQTDGIATSLVMARLFDLYGKPIAGRVVYFEVLSDDTGGKINLGTISTNYVYTDSNGIALTYYTAPAQSFETKIRIQGSLGSGSDYPYQIGHWTNLWLVIPGNKPHPPSYKCDNFTINVSIDPANPDVNQYVTFNAAGTYSTGGTIVQYTWDFGDGHSSNGILVQHAYHASGVYTVILSVVDSNGSWCGSTPQQVTVGSP